VAHLETLPCIQGHCLASRDGALHLEKSPQIRRRRRGSGKVAPHPQTAFSIRRRRHASGNVAVDGAVARRRRGIYGDIAPLTPGLAFSTGWCQYHPKI